MFFKLLPFVSGIIGVIVGGIVFYTTVNMRLDQNDKAHAGINTQLNEVDDRLRMVEKAVVGLETIKGDVAGLRADMRDIRNAVMRKMGER